MAKNVWSTEETAILRAGINDKLSWDDLQAQLPGRSIVGIKRQAWVVNLTPEERLAHHRRARSEYRTEVVHTVVAPTIVPEFVIEERDRRQLAEDRQTRASKILGDPPPGYSALDLRMMQSA